MGRSSRRMLDLNARESIWIRFEIHRDSIWDCDEFEITMQGKTEYQKLSSLCCFVLNTVPNEKALRETQTLRTDYSKAESNFFAPPQTPCRGRGTAKI